MKAEKFFEQHDNSKLTTIQEDGQYLTLKYVFELMQAYAEQENKLQTIKIAELEVACKLNKEWAEGFENQNKELIEALTILVELKDYKSNNGKDKAYLSAQPKAWSKARKLLNKH